MDLGSIRGKFGDTYIATARTFKMGIDFRLAKVIVERFAGRRVLETCTGAGFTTIALARRAAHVVSVEIDSDHQRQARTNLEHAGLLDRVTLVGGDVLSELVLSTLPPVDSAFLDPDWADDSAGHVYRFRDSNMRPPADRLLARVRKLTRDVALVLPPSLDPRELDGLPIHEHRKLFLDGGHALDCLYFGRLARTVGVTEAWVRSGESHAAGHGES